MIPAALFYVSSALAGHIFRPILVIRQVFYNIKKREYTITKMYFMYLQH